MKTNKVTKSPTVNPKKVDKIYTEVVQLFQKAKLTIPEIILIYSNLGYTLGASIGGYKSGEGPSIEDLQKLYATKPTVDVALMLQSLLTSTWVDDIDKKYEEIVAEQKIKKPKKNWIASECIRTCSDCDGAPDCQCEHHD